jgi:hypothetical protein
VAAVPGVAGAQTGQEPSPPVEAPAVAPSGPTGASAPAAPAPPAPTQAPPDQPDKPAAPADPADGGRASDIDAGSSNRPADANIPELTSKFGAGTEGTPQDDGGGGDDNDSGDDGGGGGGGGGGGDDGGGKKSSRGGGGGGTAGRVAGSTASGSSGTSTGEGTLPFTGEPVLLTTLLGLTCLLAGAGLLWVLRAPRATPAPVHFKIASPAPARVPEVEHRPAPHRAGRRGWVLGVAGAALLLAHTARRAR